jgi:bifunctional UDP-N-acetylglucosamine pyrophosphorylase/glucosamine-1-phosphate N-acetyltransferase
MKSKRSKVLHEVCGKPMLDFVLRACFDAGCQRALLVVGHGKDEVIAQFGSDKRITFVEQTEQLGTGHAARVCEPHLKDHTGDVIILAGDGPLITSGVLQTLLKAHRDDRAAASMATAILDDPYGYGRVVRDERGDFVEIVEQADATVEQREIQEVFPSIYAVRVNELSFALARLKNENKKGEFYLTDIYGILRAAGKRVTAVQAVPAEEVFAINTREQLAQVDAVMQDRIQRQLREAGVTVVSPVNTYVEANVSIGADTTLRPFTYVGADAGIGPNCVIGPFACVPRGAIVPEGTSLSGNVRGNDA